MKTWLGLMMIAVVAPVSSPQRTKLHSRFTCDASELDEIVGYTAITSSNVSGEFEGADFDKPVKLDNGMIFEFTEYSYSYSYRPEVIVFAETVTYQGRDVTLYKLLIEDDLYDARRIRLLTGSAIVRRTQ